jgi:Cft2 family RNA processing exonuclease
MQNSITCEIDWNPILQRIQIEEGHQLPTYPGDLKAALLTHAGLDHHSKGEEVYQLAREISRLSTCCDPEIVYWFSRLIVLLDLRTRNNLNTSANQNN